MLPVTELDKLQDAYLKETHPQDNVEAAFFLKQDVITLLDSIKDEDNILFVKVFLVGETANGSYRVSLAMCGSGSTFSKTTPGIVAEVPCPPLCGHELLHPKIVLPKPPTS